MKLDFEVPNMTANEMTVKLDGGEHTITVSGYRKERPADEGVISILQEHQHGYWEKTLHVPIGLTASGLIFSLPMRIVLSGLSSEFRSHPMPCT